MSGEDDLYLSRVRANGCVVHTRECGGDVQAHHAGGGSGLGQRAHDHTAIGLCLVHHDAWHAASGIFKNMDRSARREWADARIAETQAQIAGPSRQLTTGSGAIQGADHGSWKGDAARQTTKRERTQRRFTLGACERCLKPATERHHKDDDTGNNVPANIEILCRRCHMTVDGRLDRLKVNAKKQHERQRKPPRPCRICTRVSPASRMWKDRCHRCHEYWRRRGAERPFGYANAPRGGTFNGRAKLTADEVRIIRASTDSLSVLGRRFGVGKSNVSAIKKRKVWKSVI